MGNSFVCNYPRYGCYIILYERSLEDVAKQNPLDKALFLNTLVQLQDPVPVLESLGFNTKQLHKKYIQAASCLLANVRLMEEALQDYLAISLSRNTYSRNRYNADGVGYRTLVDRLIPDLESQKLLKRFRGFIERDEWGLGWGRRTRFKPHSRLLESLSAHSVTLKAVDWGNPELIRLRASKPKRNQHISSQKKIRGSYIEYKDTDATHRMRHTMERFNTFINTVKISLPKNLAPENRINTNYYRVFNGNFKQGGRFAGHWTFNIHRDDRRQLRLNGEKVSELDYSNMNVHLLYSQINKVWDKGDAYDLSDAIESPIVRELGKFGLLIAMSIEKRTGFAQSLKARIRDNGEPESYISGKQGFNSMRVLEAIESKHRPIKRLLFNPTKGLICQYMESRLLINVLGFFIDEKRPVLPLHDGIIVRRSDQTLAKEVMELAYKGMGYSSKSPVKIEY